MNKGQQLWGKSTKLIPGGNMLISKRPDLFAPNYWPTYYKKASGCYVWDLDDKKYTDMSIMGIGTNILGYSNPVVNESVQRVIMDGNMSTLNCPEEVELAEKLIKLHPWAGMAKFARGGGEANSLAIRIARAHSKKEKVVFCGYHGWHDWYMAAGKTEEGLSEHLFKDIKTNGVPNSLEGTALPFQWNNLENLQEIISKNNGDIGVIKMEVIRNIKPSIDFLKGVRDICDKNNIVLIFDECTSGFRESFGGIHLNYGVTPDIAVFGKALGNGYAISAVIGKESVMKSAKESFISSTFWTERIGNVAALAALNEMEKIKSWEKITNLGKCIQNKWLEIAEKNSLKISTGVLPAISTFSFNSINSAEYKTFLTREFLKKGYLAGNLLFVSTEHCKLDLSEYFETLDSIFEVIALREKGEIKNPLILPNEVCGETFKRLN